MSTLNLCQHMQDNVKKTSINNRSPEKISWGNFKFKFKFLYRIVVTKKELCRFGIKDDSECLHCGEQDSTEHTFSDCFFIKYFLSKVVQWFRIIEISLLLNRQIDNIYLGFFPLIKNFRNNLTTPCFLLVISSVQLSYTLILFSSQILSEKSPLSTSKKV